MGGDLIIWWLKGWIACTFKYCSLLRFSTNGDFWEMHKWCNYVPDGQPLRPRDQWALDRLIFQSTYVYHSRVSARNVWEGGPKFFYRFFQFRWLKWPILTGMTAKYEKYFYFLCQQGGDIPPWCWVGGPDPPQTPPGGNPAQVINPCTAMGAMGAQGSNQAFLTCRADTQSFAAATLLISPTRWRYAE